MKPLLFALLVSLSCALVASAQNPYGRIGGRVNDATGAVMPGVGVTATNVATNVAASTVSNERGNYEFSNLIPGNYTIRAELIGFKRYERGPIELRLGDALSIDIPMEVGQITQSVMVSAEAPMLESTNASLGEVIDNRRIETLPLPANNVLYLMQTTAGVSSGASPNYEWVPYSGWGNSSAVFAGVSGQTQFSIDGAPNNFGGGSPAINPPPELIQEFRVSTAPFDASVGRFAGGQVNMVLKSGTNTMHGNLRFTHQSRPLTTRHLYTNMYIYDPSSGPVTEAKKKFAFPFSRMNRYTAAMDGPVYIPKIYNGKNKTFWTFGWDRLDRLRAEQSFFTVPTLKQRQGDFSELLARGSQYQIYNPFTTKIVGSRYQRDPFVGNIIPGNLLDSTALKLLAFYPVPNVAGKADGQQNYFDPKPRTVDYRAWFTRVDHNFSNRHRLYGSYSHVRSIESWNNSFHNAATGQRTDSLTNTLALDDVITLRPDTILNFRYNVNRRTSIGASQVPTVDLGALGFASSFTSRLSPLYTQFPTITVDGGGYSPLGDRNYSLTGSTQQYVSGNATHMRGNHAWRFGAELRVVHRGSYSPGQVTPALNFGTTYTKLNDTSSSAPLGQGLAAFMLGIPTSGSVAIQDSSAIMSRYLGFYLHDDWKVTNNLTMNIGLRYELELPTTERFDRMNRGFDLDVANPISEAARTAYAKSPIPEVPVSQFRTPGGILFAGDNGTPRQLWNTVKNAYSPRFGLAYKLGNAMVVRGGYGIYFLSNQDLVSVYQRGYSQTTSLVPSLDNGLTYAMTLSNPFPGAFIQPAGKSQGLKTNLGQAITFIDPNNKPGYMQRWSLSIQKELPGRWLLDVGYMGNRGTGLGVTQQYSPVPAQYLSRSPVRDQATINFLAAQVNNPFYGMPEFAGTTLASSKIRRDQLLKAYPEFDAVTSLRNYGISWYHSLLTGVEKRFTKGYSIQMNYTWSKLMEMTSKLNATDALPERVISGSDRPHRVTGSALFDFPFGKGRPLLNSAPSWLNAIAGGWSMQAMYQYQTGAPIGWGTSCSTET